MPYTSIDQLPDFVKKYPEVIQRMWMHTWMSVYESTNDEKRAFMAANAVIRKRVEKHGSSSYGDNANFNCSIDKWLKNL